MISIGKVWKYRMYKIIIIQYSSKADEWQRK